MTEEINKSKKIKNALLPEMKIRLSSVKETVLLQNMRSYNNKTFSYLFGGDDYETAIDAYRYGEQTLKTIKGFNFKIYSLAASSCPWHTEELYFNPSVKEILQETMIASEKNIGEKSIQYFHMNNLSSDRDAENLFIGEKSLKLLIDKKVGATIIDNDILRAEIKNRTGKNINAIISFYLRLFYGPNITNTLSKEPIFVNEIL